MDSSSLTGKLWGGLFSDRRFHRICITTLGVSPSDMVREIEALIHANGDSPVLVDQLIRSFKISPASTLRAIIPKDKVGDGAKKVDYITIDGSIQSTVYEDKRLRDLKLTTYELEESAKRLEKLVEELEDFNYREKRKRLIDYLKKQHDVWGGVLGLAIRYEAMVETDKDVRVINRVIKNATGSVIKDNRLYDYELVADAILALEKSRENSDGQF